MKSSNTSINKISELMQSERISGLRAKLFLEERYASIEQAHIVTEVYKQNPGLPVNILRAKALKAALLGMQIRIDQGELIVGNRTAGIRGGVIFPESGLSWVDNEIENLKTRPQDKFGVRAEDIKEFREEILPFWKGRTLEDVLDERIGDEMRLIG
ncbi:MAG TPA: pyruvate formate lyase family protein, partial [Clostridia bacterium]|nr:pyruvate formate lyase family protein [Clostridia bacterium]